MADSKRNKQIKQDKIPKGKSISQGGNPEQHSLEYSAKISVKSINYDVLIV